MGLYEEIRPRWVQLGMGISLGLAALIFCGGIFLEYLGWI